MNIFALHSDPVKAAEYLDDKRVPKMVLESAQILSSALDNLGLWKSYLYKPTHKSHPCVRWAGSSRGNFEWLVMHGLALGVEYKRRFGATKDHRSVKVILDCAERFKDCRMDVLGMTRFCNCTNITSNGTDVVSLYRQYMRQSKWGLLTKWTNRGKPDWYVPLDAGIQ